MEDDGGDWREDEERQGKEYEYDVGVELLAGVDRVGFVETHGQAASDSQYYIDGEHDDQWEQRVEYKAEVEIGVVDAASVDRNDLKVEVEEGEDLEELDEDLREEDA